MKNIPLIMTATVLAATLSFTACSTGGGVATDAGNSGSSKEMTAAGSRPGDWASDLGARARSSAEDALTITQNFLSGLTNQEIDGDAFQAGWENLKSKLQDMADNADTEEARQEINRITSDLEAKVNDIIAMITGNESVQKIGTAISEFWTEARDRLAEILK